MEFLYYIVACGGIIAIFVPLHSIALSLGTLAEAVPLIVAHPHTHNVSKDNNG